MLSDSGVREKRVYYRKFRSIKRKKRKGFAGIRKKPCPRSTVGTENVGQGCFEGNQGTLTLSSAAVIGPNNDQEEMSASMSELLRNNVDFSSDDVGTITR